MEAIEAVAVVIFILAILVLIYYYLQNSPNTIQKIRSYVPSGTDHYMDHITPNNSNFEEDSTMTDDEDKKSMGNKIKVKLSDIDMSSFNTDAFSKKIDAFLDEKSDQLIKDWSLATKDDLSELEKKFQSTTSSVDELDNQFKKFKKSSKDFKKSTEKQLEEFDKRIKALEDN